MISDKLAGWMFNNLYWFDIQCIPKAHWKRTLKIRYVESGMSKKFKKGAFKSTWKFIRKEGLIREGGRRKPLKKRRRG